MIGSVPGPIRSSLRAYTSNRGSQTRKGRGELGHINGIALFRKDKL
jgi:hypothetical protein